MSFKIALNFEDGVTQFIDCVPGETLADAAYRCGVMVPLDCREGVCGTCRAHCESGRYEMRPYVDEALSAQEASEGYILTCQTLPSSDAVIQIPSSSLACNAADATVRQARIAQLELLSSSTFWLELEGADIERLRFLPGQYARLYIPGTDEHRAYSFSALPRHGRVGFLIRNVPQGRMSRALMGSARVGDALRYQAAYGRFYLRDTGRPVLMIAGGTGLGPFLAMLEQMLEAPPSVPVHLLYGVSRDEDLVCIDRLDRFKQQLPGFDYTPCVVDTATAGRLKGVVTDHLTPAHLHGGEVDVYLCGPPPMVAAVERFIETHGMKPAALHFERFAAAEAAA